MTTPEWFKNLIKNFSNFKISKQERSKSGRRHVQVKPVNANNLLLRLGFLKRRLSIVITLSFASIGVLLTIGILFNQLLNNNRASANSPTLSFISATRSGPESTANPGITVSLSPTSTSDVSFNFSVSGTNITLDKDYSLQSNSVIIPAGQKLTSLPITILNNDIAQNNRTLQISLSNVGGANLGTPGSFSYTIFDDDEEKYNPVGSDPDSLPNFDYSGINNLNVTEGLRLRLDANSISGNDGDLVGSWNDASGSGNNATQATAANQPVLKKNILNGKNTVRFDGGDGLATGNVNLTATQAVSIFSIAKVSSTPTMILVENSTNTNSSDTGFLIALNDNTCPSCSTPGTSGNVKGNTGFSVAHNSGSLTNFSMVSSILDKSKSTLEADIKVNNTFGSLQSVNSNNTNNYGNNPFFIGSRNNSSSFLNGDIAEILVYDRALSDFERSQVECFLSTKYGLNLSSCGGTSLKLHLDASQINGNDGDLIGSWNDASGNANNATQATAANQPVLKKSVVNGQNAVRFDGSNDSLQTSLTTTQNSTIFSIFRHTNSGATCAPLWQMALGQTGSGFFPNCTDNNQYLSTGNGTWLNQVTTFAINTPYLATARYNTNSTELFNNGNLSQSVATNNILTGSFDIARRQSQGTHFGGDIAEILVYDRALSETERKQVECFLSKKYDLKASGCEGSVRLWLDAGQINGNDGDAVSNWNDTSGNGNNATQGNVTNQPILKKNILNGQNVVRFRQNSITQGFTFPNVSARSTFFVFNHPSGSSPNLSADFETVVLGDGTNTPFHGNTGTGLVGCSWASASLCNGTAYSNGSLTPITSLVKTTNFRVLNLNLTGNVNVSNIALGHQLSRAMNGDVAEIIVLNSTLSTPQRAVTETYLAQKYGISLVNSKYSLAFAQSQIAGIGAEIDGIVTRSGSSSGFYISDAGLTENTKVPSLNTGEYVLVGNDGAIKTTTNTNLPVGVAGRWNRTWGLDKTATNGVNAKVSFDFSQYSGGVPGSLSNYRLLYRSGTSGNFSEIANASASLENNDRVSFSLNNVDLLDGYYTLGTTNQFDSALSSPGSVTNLGVTAGNGEVTLNWTAPANSTIDDYIIQYSSDNFANEVLTYNDGISTNTTNVVVGGLDTNTRYAFRVFTTNNAGSSSGSNITSTTTTSITPTISAITPDKGATTGGYEVTINGNGFVKPSYKRSISINNTTNGNTALTNYQVSFNLDTQSLITQGKMRSDCGDIRLTDSDDFTGLSYWIESGCNTATTTIWTKIPSINASTTKEIFVKYGDLSKNSAQTRPENIFDFYDGFDGNSIDTNKWTSTTGTATVNGGILSLGTTSGLFANNYNIPINSIIETRADPISATTLGGPVRAATTTTLGWVNDGGTNLLDIMWWNNGVLYAQTNSGETTFGSYTTGFKNYRIIYRPGGADTSSFDYNDGQLTTTRTGNNAGGTLKPVVYKGTGGATTAQWDYYRVRKISAIPPTTNTGAEQLTSTANLDFGNQNSATNINVISSTQLKATVPASKLNNAGVNPKTGGVTASLNFGNNPGATANFEYMAPRIDTITPNTGATTGGAEVIIEGDYFTGNSYLLPITITNTSQSITDYQVRLNINTLSLISSGKLKTDCSDLRVKNNDQITNLAYFIDSGCNSSNTIIWLKIPSFVNGGNLIYLSYGDKTLTSQSNPVNVFDFYDGFEGTSINQDNWEITSNTGFSVANGNLIGTNTTGRLKSKSTFSDNRILEVKNITSTRASNGQMITGFYNSTSDSIGFLNHPSNGYYRNNGTWVSFTEIPNNNNYLYSITAKNSTQVDLKIQNLDNNTAFYSLDNLANTVTNEKITIGKRYDDTDAGTAYNNQAYNSVWDYIRVRKYLAVEPTFSLGTELNVGIKVTINEEPAVSTQLLSPTQLQFTTPSNPPGTYTVKIVSSDGTQSNTNINFSYGAPVVTSVTPNTGPNSGGQYVEIKGDNFGVSQNNIIPLTISNSNTTPLLNYQAKFSLDTQILIAQGKMKSDCSNIRIRSFDNTDLPYFLESGCNTASTTLWTKVPTIPANGSLKINLWYGLSTWTSQSNPNTVFDFFDGFDGTSIDTSKWLNNATTRITQNNKLIIDGGNSWSATTIYSVSSFDRTDGEILEFDMNFVGQNDWMGGWKNNSTDTNYPSLVYGYHISGTSGTSIYEDGNYRGAFQPNWAYQSYKIRITAKPTGAIYQRSDDGGKTWTTHYDSIYSSQSPLKIGFVNYNTKMEIDNVRTYKYISTVPTITMGTPISAASVSFGNNETNFEFINSQTLRGFVPAGSGNVNIKVTNSDGSNGTSTANLYTYGSNNVPNQIFDLNITREEGQNVDLAWTAPFANGTAVTDYIIKYSQNNFETETVFNDGVNTNTTTTLTGLNIGQSYQFKVIAVNEVGNSLDSNVVSVTSLDCNTNLNGANLIISTNQTLVGSYCNINEFRVNSGITATLNNQITPGSSTPGKAVKIYSQTANILGTINGIGTGFQGGRNNNTSDSGFGPGGGIVNGNQCYSFGVAGGYGGTGGLFGTATGGLSYGSVTQPVDMGSGGSSGCNVAAGNGGGSLKLSVINTLTVNGSITANGGDGTGGYGAGGSGGSIWLQSGTFTGNGSVTANGGLRGTSDGRVPSGGGGRIALYYTTKTHSGSVLAAGGNSAGTTFTGGAGTIYEKAVSQSFGTLRIDNNNITGTSIGQTPVNNSNLPSLATLDNFIVTNKANVILSKDLSLNNTTFDVNAGSSLTTNNQITFSNLASFANSNPGTNNFSINGTLTFKVNPVGGLGNGNVQSTGILTHAANSTTTALPLSTLDLSFNNLTIATGGKIDVTGLGFLGGNQAGNSSSNGLGTGGGIGSTSSSVNGGGGYGGNGGGTGGGSSYGSITQPINLGSGGGAYSAGYNGGNGGGAIKLNVTNTLTVNGSILANGNSSTNYGSGGSGGSIWIEANTFTGAGIITANGGGNNSNHGGGGGGGRVALYYQNRTGSMTQGTSTSSIIVNGGSGVGDCVEVLTGSNPATYSNTTSGCTGTIYDPNTPQANLTAVTFDTTPNPPSTGVQFSASLNNVRNTFGFNLFSGTCSVSLSGPGNYSTAVVRNGTVINGVCALTTAFPAPDTTGTINVAISVTGNSNTQTASRTFEIYATASNLAKAQASPNQSKPIFTSLIPNPLTSIIGNSGPTLTASGFIDSQNNQALNGLPCSFTVTGPDSYSQNFVSSNMVGGSCSYTFSAFELPSNVTTKAGSYSFSVTLAGKDTLGGDVQLTTDPASFSRFFNVYLENPGTPGVFNKDGKIPGVSTANPSTIALGNTTVMTSPVINAYNNTTLIATGTACTTTIEIDNNTATPIIKNYNSTINNSGQCVINLPSGDLSSGTLRTKTSVTLVLNGQNLIFETNYTTIPTTGFPSNLAKFNPTQTITTPEIQPIYTVQTISANPSFVGSSITLSLTGLVDSANNLALGANSTGPLCKFVITRSDNTTTSVDSTPVSNGSCSVAISNTQLGSNGGNFSFRVQVNGKDATNSDIVLTTPSTNFSRRYDINLSGANGLSGTLPGITSASPNPILATQSAVITSPVLKKFNTTTNLDTGTPCRLILRFVNNLNQETITNFDSTTNSSGQCTTTIPGSNFSSIGTAYFKTKIALFGSALSGSNNDVFETSESQILVKNPSNSRICTPTFRDDNSSGIWDTQSGNGLTNQVGQDEPLLTGVSARLLDSNLTQISGRTLTTTLPTVGNPNINCFSNLFDDTYYLEVTLPASTTLTGTDIANPPAGITILRNTSNIVTGIRYQVTLGVNNTQSFTTGFNANAQICVGSSFVDLDGNGSFNGSDYKLVKSTRLYLSNNLNSPLSTQNTSLTGSTCFTALPPTTYNTYNVNYVVEQDVPAIGNPDFLSGGEISTITQNLSGAGFTITLSQQVNNTKVRTSNLTLSNGQNLSSLNFGYKRLASYKAQAQTNPNQTKPTLSNFSFASLVNNAEISNKAFKNYQLNVRVNGLVDSSTGTALNIPNTIPNFAQACSINFTGPSFNTPKQAFGTITNGTCLVQTVAENAGTGNIATVTVAGDNGDLLTTDTFDVLSGNLNVCSFTFADYNGDTNRQTNEAYLAGRNLRLFNNTTNSEVKSFILSTTTGNDCFTQVEPGISYRLEQTAQANNFATTNLGSTSYVFTPDPEQNQTFKFGYQGNSSICPFAFRDDSGDGLKNTNTYGNLEPELTGIFTAILKDSSGNQVNSFSLNNTTCFTNLLTGNYELSQTFSSSLKIGRTNFSTGTTAVSITEPLSTINRDFGYQNQATICTNPTFNDYNKNGSRDNGEPLINNLVVKLLRNSNNQQIGNDLILNGTNCFTQLIPDTYKLEQTKPDGGVLTVNSTANTVYSQTETTATALITSVFGVDNIIPFGYKGQATICPYPTFADINKNGTKDNGELDLNGIVTVLRDSTGTTISTITTNSIANTCFTEILPGNYRVLQTAPVNTSSSTGGTNIAVDNLLVTETRNLAFGYNGDPKICPIIFRDDNFNLVQNGSEPRLSGVLVTLKNSTGTITLDTLTSSTANQNCFSNLTNGTYTVEVGLLTNYNLTTTSSRTVTVNFGEQANPEFGYNGGGSICVNSTFKDSNSNGLLDNGESKFNEINTYLKYTNGSLVTPVQITDNDGNTCFTSLAPGQYVVSQDSPTGSTSTTGGAQSIVLAPSEAKVLAFGYNGSGTVCANPTFDDPNFDGLKNTTENLLSGINTRLYLQSNLDTPIQNGTTNSSGTICFVGLFPGNYTLIQDIPENYGANSSTTGGNERQLTLNAGEILNLGFGYTTNPDFILGAIRGFLYVDRAENEEYNPNGQDGAEITVFDNDIRLTQAEVQLAKKNPQTNFYEFQASLLTTSNPDSPELDGAYSFIALEPGDYKISVSPPFGTKSVVPNPSEAFVTITATQKISNLDFRFQYKAEICPVLFVDKNKNNVLDNDDIDLIATAGAYYQLQYQSFNGTQVAGDYNINGYLVNAQNPCIKNLPPRDYTVAFNRTASQGNGTSQYPGLGYNTLFDTALYDQITGNQTVTVFLDSQIIVKNSYFTNFVPNNTNSVIGGRIWNDRSPEGTFDADGFDNQTGISGNRDYDYDNDFVYSGITVTLKKCSPGFGEVQADVTSWNQNMPSSTTNAQGYYSFPVVPPGTYAVIRNTDLSNQEYLAGLNTNDCAYPGNYIFINNSYNFSGGVAPGTNITYDIKVKFKASITNNLYIDQNGNGLQDSWETNGQFGNSQTGEQSLIDNNDNLVAIQNSNDPNFTPPYGNVFPTVPPGNYTMSFNSNPANYPLISADQGIKNVDITGSTTNASLSYGFNPTTQSTVSGRVFVDRANNNIYENNGLDNNNTTSFDNDTPVTGAVIQLYYGAILNPVGAQFVATTTTDSQGNYSFSNIPEGYYSARITTTGPANTVCIRCDWGYNSSRVDMVYVNKESTSVQNLRYNYNSALKINAFYDTLVNSIRDEREVNAAGMKFRISSSDNYVLGTVDPNQIGNSFIDLPPGQYTVDVQNIPAGISLTGYNQTHTINLLTGSTLQDYAFTPFTNNNIEGSLFVDRNLDGILQPNGLDNVPGNFDDELPFTGATVRINGPLGTYTTTTNSQGFYQFTNLPSGNYKLHNKTGVDPDWDVEPDVDLNNNLGGQVVYRCFTAIACKTLTADADGHATFVWDDSCYSCRKKKEIVADGVNLFNATTVINNFSYEYTNTINARCIDDLNGDGSITFYPDTGYTESPITGCSFRITTPTGQQLSFNTGQNISSTRLPPGTYTVAKLNDAPARSNTNTIRRNVAPNLNLGNQAEISFTFTNAAGFYQKAYFDFMQFIKPITNNSSITGKTYIDKSEDTIFQQDGIDGNPGTLEDNDIILPDIPISLSGNNPGSGIINRNTTTSNQGKYQFTDLPKGNFTITADFE